MKCLNVFIRYKLGEFFSDFKMKLLSFLLRDNFLIYQNEAFYKHMDKPISKIALTMQKNANPAD